MIQITCHPNDVNSNHIIDKIKALCVAFNIIKDEKIQEIFITDGNKKIKGFDAIDKYLSELKDELHSWHYCAC